MELSKKYFDRLLENFVSLSSQGGVPDWGSVKTMETEAVEELLKRSEIEVWSLSKDLPYARYEVDEKNVISFCQVYYEGLLSGIKAQSSRNLAPLYQKPQIDSNRSMIAVCENYYESLLQKLTSQSNREISNLGSQISIQSLSQDSKKNSLRQVQTISKQFYTDIIANLRLTSEIEINSLKSQGKMSSDISNSSKFDSVQNIASNFLASLIQNLNIAPSEESIASQAHVKATNSLESNSTGT